ncbi:glycosyltransferase [Candidatus Woesearchaeota archaeon]|nr:glycosyltransferase [Candidatus Woesearchaeota archaeon]
MISIIIPALNEEKYLTKLLDCIKKQAYKDYEVIVADADSKDTTKQIAKKYGCRIVKGGLPGIGRNNGAKAAKGDILFFLDADVQFDNNFLKNAIEEFEKRKLDVAGLCIYPQGNNLVDKIFLSVFNLWTFSTQLFYPNASGSGIMCKKWIFKKVKGFDETIKLSEDMDYVKRCSKHGKFRILKSAKSYVAMRRFEKEGRLKVGLKLLLSGLHRLLFGEIRSDVFKYDLRYRK